MRSEPRYAYRYDYYPLRNATGKHKKSFHKVEVPHLQHILNLQSRLTSAHLPQQFSQAVFECRASNHINQSIDAVRFGPMTEMTTCPARAGQLGPASPRMLQLSSPVWQLCDSQARSSPKAAIADAKVHHASS